MLILSGMKVKAYPTALLVALCLAVWLAPSEAGAASVKSVQTGTVAMTSTTQTVSITTVDSTKAFVLCTDQFSGSDAAFKVECELSNSTVTLNSGDNKSTVQWYVAEFEGGVSVQRGTTSFSTSAATVNVAISAVDLTKSFVLVSQWTTDGSTNIDEEWTIRAQLTSSTNLELSRNETGISVTVAWQVVQMQGASVQRGLSTINKGSASTTASISTVDTSKSFLVMSRRGGTAVAGIEARYQVRGELTNSTTLTFTRADSTNTSNNIVDIAWEVVSLSDGGTVQKGTVSASTSASTMNAALSPAVDTSRSVPFISISGAGGGDDRDLDQTSWTANISSATNLQLQRQQTGLTSQVAWFVVQFFKCSAVTDVSYVAADAQSGQAIVYWSSATVIILRKTSAFAGEVPLNGQPYSTTAPVNPGDPPNTIGAATVVYNGSVAAASFTNTGLTNSTNESTRYYYKVFATTGTGGASCYAPGTVNSTSGVNASPVAGPDPAWGYMLDGGSILKGGTAGTGTLYVTSNASRIISLSTANGTQSWTPVATNAVVQGWLNWFPVSGGSASAVVGGDQSGRVYSVDTATGATNWQQLTLTGAQQIQAPVSVQIWSFSNAAFQANYSIDVVFAATRNSSTTNNKVFALRATDGVMLWTFNPDPTPPYAVDYIVGQPWVDYTRNYLYVTSRAGANGTQNSLWVINTLDGSLVASFALGHLETSPTVSADGATLYVGSKDATNPGKLYAINLNTLALKWTSPMSLGATNTAYINGFVWEDFTTAGRLYFSTADGNVWCVQDPGAGAPPSGAVWKTAVAGPSTPVLIDKLYVGSSDGKLHQFNPTSGVDEKQFTVGDGTATVGDASTEDGTQVFVGTTAGKIYKLPLPLP